MEKSTLQALNQKGILRVADSMPTFSPNNIGMPAGILSQLSKEAVMSILAYRAGDDALGGRKKILDWEKQEYFLPMVERTGVTQIYSDYDDAVKSGLNITFGRTGHYTFSSTMVNGERQNLQIGEAGMNAEAFILEASLEAIAIELNRVAFNGYVNNNNSFLVTGLLNDPSLNSYIGANKQFNAMSFNEAITFFATALAKLREQTGNNIQKGSKIRCVIASKAFDTLWLKVNDLGVSVIDAVLDRYNKLGITFEFVSAIELDGANATQDVIYFILENSLGGVSDTTILGYSELGRMSNVVVGHNFTSQKVSAGTTGAVVYKPSYIVRYTNI